MRRNPVFLSGIKISGPLDHKPEENIIGNASLRWQRYSQLAFVLCVFHMNVLLNNLIT